MTKPDKTGHLTVAQENAIDALVLGKSDREAAEVAGVARQTVTGWRLHHPYFQAELNRRRMAVFGEAQNRLRALLPVALERLEREITSEASEVGWKAALELLKLGHLTPGEAGMTDAEAIIESHAFGRRGGDPVDALLAQVNGAKPSDQEKQEALRELLEKASAQGREVDA